MRIALVHDWLTGMRGGEKCLEAIARHFPDAQLLTLVHRRGSTSPVIEERPITTSFLQHLPGATRYYRWLLPLMPSAVERLRVPRDVDLVLSFSHAVAKSIRVPTGVPHVCYCFTPMRYAWHLREAYFDSHRSSRDGGTYGVLSARLTRRPLALAREVLLDRLQSWDRTHAAGVTHFVAASRTVAARIAEAYDRPSEVIYPPVDCDYFTPGDVERDDYYLCVSALVPYKRVDLAIAACRKLGRRLVVIGSGPQQARLARWAGAGIELVGWQSRATIRAHLRRCRGLLFPGEEDFGIVPLEAAACGTPVIAYARGGATETVVPGTAVAPGTGWWFEPQTVDALAAAMLRAEQQPEAFSSRRARAQAERFATPRFESQLLAFLEQAAAAGAEG